MSKKSLTFLLPVALVIAVAVLVIAVVQIYKYRSARNTIMGLTVPDISKIVFYYGSFLSEELFPWFKEEASKAREGRKAIEQAQSLRWDGAEERE